MVLRKISTPKRKETRNSPETPEDLRENKRMMRKVELHFKNKDCILVFRDHVIRKRAGPRKAE